MQNVIDTQDKVSGTIVVAVVGNLKSDISSLAESSVKNLDFDGLRSGYPLPSAKSVQSIRNTLLKSGLRFGLRG